MNKHDEYAKDHEREPDEVATRTDTLDMAIVQLRAEVEAKSSALAALICDLPGSSITADMHKAAQLGSSILEENRFLKRELAARPDELWRAIPEHPYYEASDMGRVRSFRQSGGHSGRDTVPKLLKPRGGHGGQVEVDLGGVSYSVHRLVLLTFAGPCPSGHECARWDGKPENNCLGNLRWATREANEAGRDRHGASDE